MHFSNLGMKGLNGRTFSDGLWNSSQSLRNTGIKRYNRCRSVIRPSDLRVVIGRGEGWGELSHL